MPARSAATAGAARLLLGQRRILLSPEGQEHNHLLSDFFLRHVLGDQQGVVDG
jgi:hypothetical protein